MANEDKPRGRFGKPSKGGAGRTEANRANPSGDKRGGLRSRGFKDGPAGGKPAGKSRGYKDRPAGAGGFKPGPFRDRPVRDEAPAAPVRESGHAAARDPHAAEVEAEVAAQADPERIAKYMARAGVASRRDAERMIEMGRVTLNGQKLQSPAVNVTASDVILVDGQPIPEIERTRLWLYHKPAGLVTTNRDPEGRPTVFENLPNDMPRVLSIGRLDINTEGLLLLTNDGGLARMLELPQTGWLRRYRVRAHGKVEQSRLDELKNGIAVDGVFYGAVEAEIEREQGANIWLTVGLREGKNREVKNILGALGLDVNRLIRISFGPFQLGELPEGAVLEIKGKTLRDQLGARLIEEAGANFDAPVRKPFTNKAVRAEEGETRLVQVTKRGDWVTSTPGRPPKRGAGKGAGRDEALARLDTRKPERDDRRSAKRDRPAAGSTGDSDKQRHGRSANVWMAPGARPQGKKPKPVPEGVKKFDGPRAGKSISGAKSHQGGKPSRDGGHAGARRSGKPGGPQRKG